MLKRYPFFLMAVLFIMSIQNSWSQSKYEPFFPRTAVYCTYQGYIDARIHRMAQYDMAYIYGSVDNSGSLFAQRLRELHPDQIIMAMGLNGLWFSDPPDYYLYRAYQGILTEPVQPNQRVIKVDRTEGIAQGLNGNWNLCYAVIGDDIINVEGVRGDTGIVAQNVSDSFYNTSHSHSIGDTVYSPLRLAGPGIFMNLSQWAPEINGLYPWEYLAEKNFNEKIDYASGLFDGFFHDAFYDKIYLDSHSCDMNRNGIDDYDEFGGTRHNAGVWINNHYSQYLEKLISNEVELMNNIQPDGPNLFGVNAGGTLDSFREELNGHCYEGFLRWANWYYLKDDCIEWMQYNSSKNRPSTMFIEDYIPEKWTHNGKDRFNKMRFGLTTALLFDCYYGMTFGDWYYIMFWYDEFETNLGFGISEPIQLENGLWIRYFDNGLAVCNPTGTNQTLSPASLDGRTYYRLKGGQDPETNNGEIFDEPIEIYGHAYGTDLRGDGIIMFTEPTTAVSDIIVDNFYNNDTSPGSNPVELSDNWRRYDSKMKTDIENNNPFWAQINGGMVVGNFDEAYGYHAIQGGDGSAQAIWRPTIGVAGYYEMAEWHGWHGDTKSSFQEATNVPFEIVLDGETKIRGIIDQTKNCGQWNVIGYGYLSEGLNNYVKITNNADGYVIADAIRFRYLGEIDPDTTPPDPPSNVRIIE